MRSSKAGRAPNTSLGSAQQAPGSAGWDALRLRACTSALLTACRRLRLRRGAGAKAESVGAALGYLTLFVCRGGRAIYVALDLGSEREKKAIFDCLFLVTSLRVEMTSPLTSAVLNSEVALLPVGLLTEY